MATILIPFCYFISGLFGYVISRDIFSRVLGFASGFVSRICNAGSFIFPVSLTVL